jgi:hypothetical protein
MSILQEEGQIQPRFGGVTGTRCLHESQLTSSQNGRLGCTLGFAVVLSRFAAASLRSPC